MANKIKQIKSDSVALNGFLHSYSRNQMVVKIDEICAGCLVLRQTVHNWKNGLCRIPELHKRKIEEIFNKEIFPNITKR